MDWLGLEGRTIVVTGVANKKSVAWHVGRGLAEAGAHPIYVVHTAERRAQLAERLAPHPVLVCDVERPAEIEALRATLAAEHPPVDGLVHSIAFANYGGDAESGSAEASADSAFHRVSRADFLQAVDVSCFSLVALSRALEERFDPDASVVTISISATDMAAENYGFMGPAKAALDSTVVFLAKSFSASTRVRFNAVKAGPLKTASSAGIPGYVESYLFAEAATFRKRAVRTQEVADTALFLLSPRSAGINGQGLVVDAGMGKNYFDRALVERATRVEP